MILSLEEDSAIDQLLRGADIPPGIAPAKGELKTLALHFLLDHCKLGGAKWIQQFNFGFPLIGPVSQAGVYKIDPSAKDPHPIDEIWAGPRERFAKRAQSSGRLRGAELWDEACSRS